jgi:hypothetical protein
MLLQDIIGARLDALEDLCIGSLHLAIGLWMSNGRIADLDAQILAVAFDGTAGELVPVVRDDPIWDPEPAHD